MSPLPSFASFMLSGLLLATAPAVFSPTQAADARIGDFRFECRTPDGKRLKPKFGDVEGAYFTDLPGQRDACLAAVDRKIALCRENTSFISNTQDREYAGCLPVFQSQAQGCVAFFQAERAKCNAGGTGAAAPGGGSGLAGMGNAAAAPDPWGDGSSNGGDSVWDPPASEDPGFVEVRSEWSEDPGFAEVRSEWSEDPGFVEVRPGQVVGNAAAAPDPWGDGSSNGGDSVWDPPASEDPGFVEVRSEWSEDPGFAEVRSEWSEDPGFVEVRSEWSEDPGFVEVRPGQVVGNAAAAPDPWGDGSSNGGDSVWDPPASEDPGFVEVRSEWSEDPGFAEVRSEWSEDPGFVEVRPGQVVGSSDGDADEDASSYATALSEVLGDDAPQREATQDDYTGALAALERQREAEREAEARREAALERQREAEARREAALEAAAREPKHAVKRRCRRIQRAANSRKRGGGWATPSSGP